jgi:hypothetical protein
MEAARTPFTRRLAVAFLGAALATAFAAGSVGNAMVTENGLAASAKTATTVKKTATPATQSGGTVSAAGKVDPKCGQNANKPRCY